MIGLYLVGYTTHEGMTEEGKDLNWAWNVEKYAHYEDAAEYFNKIISGASWKSEKIKAIYLAAVHFSWETGVGDVELLQKHAHPPKKVVQYNKQDVVSSSRKVKPNQTFIPFPSGSSVWQDHFADQLFSTSETTPNDYPALPQSVQPEEPPTDGH